MPISRYEIRNEFSLADPELYQTADKDDPEALLEGVAMAGLVGLLRELGDLAEFAAEIFHNLHEEVVATAARGHGLMARVQQLEAEIPYIEKAFLSQTDHSSFFNHSGVDWHPNIRVDQNLVTQGDLPRFIMDSYEECREPPRLFLLDKFDVAGAGACLKRYTDPSFYKVECTNMSSANMQREKKILKAKRKGPRWKNGEVPETSLVSHSKLHQLFLEEHVENGVRNSSSRVKLKRRLNGYPFDTKTGKSYMEKLLSSSPDHEEVYEVTKDTGPLMLMANEQDKLKSEVIEERQPSPRTLSVRRKRSALSSPVGEEVTKRHDIPADDISRSPNSYPSNETEANEISLTHDEGSCESKKEDNLLGYHSDDISSEIDYVDAPSTVETEMDTDTEVKVKDASTSSHSNNQPLASNGNEENRYSKSDSQSIGDSISDAGSSSSKMLNHSSDSSRNSAENSVYDKTADEKYPCADIPETEVVESSLCKRRADEHFPAQQYSETMVHEASRTGLDEVNIHSSDFEHLSYSISSSDSPPIVTQNRDNGKPWLSSEEYIKDEIETPPIVTQNSNNVKPWLSSEEYIKDEIESKSLNASTPAENEPLNIIEASPEQEHEEVSVSRDLSCRVEDNHTDSVFGNQICSMEPNALHLLESPNLDGADSSVHVRFVNPEEDIPKHEADVSLSSSSCEVSRLDESCVNEGDVPSSDSAALRDLRYPGKLEETTEILCNTPEKFDAAADNSFSTSEKIEDHVENICSPSGKFEEAADASCSTPEELEEPAERSHDTPEISQDHTEKLCSGPEKTEDPLEISRCSAERLEEPEEPIQSYSDAEEKFKEPAEISDNGETDGREFAESYADLKSLNKDVHVFDESIEEKDEAASEEMASDKPYTVDDNTLPLCPNKMVVESSKLYFVDSGLDEPENDDKNVIPGNHVESGFMDEADETKDDTSVLDAAFVNSVSHQAEISDDDEPDSHLNSEINLTSEVPNPSEIQSPEENGHLDQEFLVEGGLLNRDFDAPLQSNCEQIAEEVIPQEEDNHGQELQNPGGTKSDSTPLPPINQQEILELNDHRGASDSVCFSPPNHTTQFLPELPTPHEHDFNLPSAPNNPFAPNFPPPTPFIGIDEVNLTDLPPLPPLPPVQWRLGKQPFSATEVSISQKDPSSHEISTVENISTSGVSENQSPVQMVPETEENIEDTLHQTANVKQLQFAPNDSSLPGVNSFLHENLEIPPTNSDTSAEDRVTASEEAPTQSSLSTISTSHETIVDIQPKIDIEQKQLENETATPAEDEGVGNGVRSLKARLPSPLVDDASVLDKSKASLRKVAERVRPELKKVDERDSFLQQIKTRSFNLKPAVPSRPTNRGPSTNLNVAAILEKANAIRQALAGSDEDEDSWSDS